MKIKLTVICAVLFLAGFLTAQPGVLNKNIHADQFGYLPQSQKIAVLGNPQIGYNSDDSYQPGNTMEVRRSADDVMVFSGTVTSWKSGQTHDQSGDQVWWFDFSSLSDTGSYYLYDPHNDAHSYEFRISEDVYSRLLEVAVRAYYYQRCGTPKQSAFAGTKWSDAACHLGTQQDLDCRLVTNPDPSSSRDLSGGWHDAGDYNKYINYADDALHALLAAYEENTSVWRDDYNIPESGNGIPDILDEIKWELDWFLKMQTENGSVLHKLSVTEWQTASPPSDDTARRYYGPATASATISFCAAVAHAAIVFKSLNDTSMQRYGENLENAAIDAWDWLEEHPGQIPSHYDNAGFSSSSSEDGDYEQGANRVSAAAYLFVLTGDTKYRTFFDSHYTEVNLLQDKTLYYWETTYQDALLYYTRSAQATQSVKEEIKSAYITALNKQLNEYQNGTDAYRAYMSSYDWGSNEGKGDFGCAYMNMIIYDLNPTDNELYKQAASGYIHYMHGVNPVGIVYLSNMYDYGAEYAVDEFYHGWFTDGSDWDNARTSLYGPAPGIIPGGPNPHYKPDDSYSGPPIEPPQNQPDQKSWRSWNADWPENSWEVSENQITYQAPYIKLLSKFVNNNPTSASYYRGNVIEKFSLEQNYPNPFNPSTTIRYSVETQHKAFIPVRLTVYNALGQKVKTLVNEIQHAGRYSVKFYASGLTSGIYFYELKAGRFHRTRKMLVIR